MSDLNAETHPTSLTDDQRAALQKADPAAFDLDDEQEQPDAEQAEKDAAEAERLEAERVAAEQADDKGEESRDAGPKMIPKARLNEALRDRDVERQRADQLAAELEALRKGPPVDYGEEIQKLDAAWNSDGDDAFEGTHAEYLAKRDGLLAQKVKADARAEIEAERQEEARLKAEADWSAAAAAFVDAHPIYKAGTDTFDADRKADLESALHGVFAKFPNESDADKLARAHKIVQAMNGEVEAKPDTKGPHDGRNKADAQASAKASATPPAITGGVSSAGGPIGTIDMNNLKPGQFSKLTKEQQAAALGGVDAL